MKKIDRKILFSSLFLLLLGIFFAGPAKAEITFNPTSPQPCSDVETITDYSCSIGNNIIYFSPSGIWQDKTVCPGTFGYNCGQEYGNFIFIECDSTIPLSNCNQTDLELLRTDPGFISESSFEILDPSILPELIRSATSTFLQLGSTVVNSWVSISYNVIFKFWPFVLGFIVLIIFIIFLKKKIRKILK